MVAQRVQKYRRGRAVQVAVQQREVATSRLHALYDFGYVLSQDEETADAQVSA